MESVRQQRVLVICSIVELLMDFFLMSYLFKSRGDLTEDDLEDNAVSLVATTGNITFSADKDPIRASKK